MKEQAGNQEQQDYFDIFVAQGIKAARNVVQDIQGSTEPKVIADAMLGIITKITQEGAKNGIKFPLEIIQAGGADVLVALMGLAGIKPEPELIKQVVGIVVGKFMKGAVASGEVTQDQLQQAAQQVPEEPAAMPQQGVQNG